MANDTICILFNYKNRAKLPIYGDTIIIPETIDGESVMEWCRLSDHYNCDCLRVRDRIRKVVVKCPYLSIVGSLQDFHNLEEIEIHGKVDIENSGIEDCKKFKRITIGKEVPIRDLKTLMSRRYFIKEMKFIESVPVYPERLFKDYLILEPSWVLQEGLVYIKNEAFYGCKRFVDVKLPKSLRCLHINAFKGCTNIESFRINSLINIEGSNSLYWNRKRKEALLSDSNDVTVYCPLDYPINYLKKHLNPNVKIVEDGVINPGVNLRNSSKKMKLLGIGGIRDIPENFDMLVQSLELIDEEVWKRQLINEVINVVQINYAQCERIIGDGLFFVKVKINMPIYEDDIYKKILSYNSKYMFKQAKFKDSKVILEFVILDWDSNEHKVSNKPKGFEISLLVDRNAILKEIQGDWEYWASSISSRCNGIDEQLLVLMTHSRLIYD